MKTAAFFNHYYDNANLNCILIMTDEGIILDVNKAFTANFGYSNEAIRGKNFSTLFTKSDREENKPQLELETVALLGHARDENYIVNQEGVAIWVLGESLLVLGQDGEKYVVKDIINLQARKQLDFFLIETEELLNRIFESSSEIAMLILDGGMRITKANQPFLDLFEISQSPLQGSRLSEIGNLFWNTSAMKKEIRAIITKDLPIKNKEFLLEMKSGEKKKVKLDSRVIERQTGTEKKIFIMIENV